MKKEKKIEPLPGIILEGKGILLINTETLIIGDIHIGQQEALKKTGIMIPLYQYEELEKELIKTINQSKPKKIILNGDIKHHFGTISIEEWDQILKFLRTAKKYAEIIIIKGNHDKVIEPIAKKLEIPIKNYYYENNKEDKIYVCHGDEIPNNKEYEEAKTIIIGHEHPAITLREGARTETYKCFLKGKITNLKEKTQKTLIVMPSFNPLNEGTNILTQKLLSPFLKNQDLSKFNIYVIGEQTYNFGLLKNIQKI